MPKGGKNYKVKIKNKLLVTTNIQKEKETKNMAYTVSSKQSVMGNQRVVMMDITADAATQTVETGLKKINAFSSGPQSLSTAGIKIYANSNASGVQSYGVLGLSGLVSGDELFIVVYGE